MNDPKNLQDLYPTPKTYEEKQQAVFERRQRFEKRRPKLPALKIALYASAVFYLALVLSRSIAPLWSSGGIVGVSVTFGGSFVLMGAIYLCAKYVYNTLSSYDRSVMPLMVFYLPAALVLFGGALSSWIPRVGSDLNILVAAAVNFTVLLIITHLTLRSQS